MKRRLERYILEGPWEEQLHDGLKTFEKWVIWPGLACVVFYFGIGWLWAFVG